MVRLTARRCLAISILGVLAAWWANAGDAEKLAHYRNLSHDALMKELTSDLTTKSGIYFVGAVLTILLVVVAVDLLTDLLDRAWKALKRSPARSAVGAAGAVPAPDHPPVRVTDLTPHPRRPLAAALLSALLPGLGHLYAGQPQAGFNRWLLGSAVGWIVTALLFTFPFGPATLLVAAALALGTYVWIILDGARAARAADEHYHLRAYNSPPVYIAIVIAAVMASGLLRAMVGATVAKAYRVPSGSMEPTILIGDYIMASRVWGDSAVGVARGALVVFESAEEPGVDVIKRVVGVAGDTLAMRDNVLIRNGRPVAEPYVMLNESLKDVSEPEMRKWQLPHLIARNQKS
jgi:signal peptidase I